MYEKIVVKFVCSKLPVALGSHGFGVYCIRRRCADVAGGGR
jgi:hypothetical protein